MRYCYNSDQLKLVNCWHSNSYQFAIANIYEQEHDQEKEKPAMFGQVLTHAAERVVYNFLEKCGDAIFQAILEREDDEEKEIENLDFAILKR
jgi:hypothetical protein